MSAMTRSIRLPIAHATATTCGDGSGNACPLIVRDDYRWVLRCAAFRQSENLAPLMSRVDKLFRWPECIAAEVEDV